MAQFEKLWEFSDHQVLVTDTAVIATNIIDWTTSEYVPWINSGVDLWIVVTCNVVPTGTSVVVSVYQDSDTTISNGDLLMTGRVMAVADLSANPKDRGHILFAVPFSSCLGNVQAADIDRYFGLVYTCAGNCTDGYVDAHLRVGKPEIPTTQVVTSNI